MFKKNLYLVSRDSTTPEVTEFTKLLFDSDPRAPGFPWALTIVAPRSGEYFSTVPHKNIRLTLYRLFL